MARVLKLPVDGIGPLPALHVQSYHSLYLGTSSVTALIQAAVDARCTALALTDRNTLAGIVPFWRLCRETGMPALLGVTVDDPQDARRSAVCWARSRHGYAALCALISRRNLDPQGFDLTSELAMLNPEEIWAGTGHLGVLVQVAKRRPPEGWIALLYPDTRPAMHSEAGQLSWWGEQFGLRVALTPNVMMARPHELGTHEVLRRIAAHYRGRWTPHADALIGTVDTTIWDAKAQQRWTARYLDAARTAIEIAEACADRVDLTRRTWVHPPCHLPPGVTAEDVLIERSLSGCRLRYGNAPPAIVTMRLDHELSTICNLGYAAHVIVACELVDHAQAAGAVSLGRGSVADSLVAYCCGLTEVDPIAHDLYFERFLNPARETPPDIDLDFSWRTRDDMLRFLFEGQPLGHVAMVGCQHTLHARGAYRHAARALGLRPELVALSKRLPYTSAQHLSRISEEFPELEDLPLNDPEVRNATRIAQALAGMPVAIGMHPCGVVVTPRPLTHWTPLFRCAKGLLTTQFDMFAVEDMGLVKLDVLSTRGLGTVDTVRAVLRDRGWDDPLTDDFATATDTPTVRRLIQKGLTIGCFYNESPAMTQLNQKVRCSDFATLIATTSVIRPGVAESGMMDQYIRRHLGLEPTVYPHPALEPLLRDTHGVMIYQEDVLRVAHELAGFTLAEADTLRRAMNFKKRAVTKVEPLHRRFIRGCGDRGVSPTDAEEIWRQIASFADFAFCKAHSAAYSRLSMQTTRLKADYPAEFLAAVLSNQGGYYPPVVYVEEARRWGLTIHGPDVNGSQHDYWGYGTTLRVGLLAIKGLQSAAIKTLVATRDGRPFEDFPSFLARTHTGQGGLDPAQVHILINAGACDTLGESHAALRLMLFEHVKNATAQRERSTGLLFPECGTVPLHHGGPTDDRDEHYSTVLELLGFLPQCHPLAWLRPSLRWTKEGPPLVAVRDLARYAGRHVRVMGLGLTRKPTSTRKTHERMAFMGLNDETGTAEVTFFPRAYARSSKALLGWGPYLVQGLVDTRYGVVSLTAESVERPVIGSVALPEAFTRAVPGASIVAGDPEHSTYIDGHGELVAIPHRGRGFTARQVARAG